MKQVLFAVVLFFTFQNLIAQPEVRKLAEYELKGDVSSVVSKDYSGKMSFGELVTDKLIETTTHKFDQKGNLIEFELINSDKHEKNSYKYNANDKLIQISSLDGSNSSYEYSNNRLIKIDTYNKNNKLERRVKRTYNSPSSFVDITYNGDGSERGRSTYKNNLLVKEVVYNNTTNYIYNANKKLIEKRYSGVKVDMGDVLSAFMMANALGDVSGINDMQGKKVNSTTRLFYNEKGFIRQEIVTGTNTRGKTATSKYKYDSKGNWILKITTLKENNKDYYLITERNINYYSSNESSTNNLIRHEKAEFPGGEKAMTEFINENLIYPKSCQEMGIQGRVTVSFIVSKEDGSLKDIKVERGVDSDMDKEAIRIVSSMPKWIPAIEDDKQTISIRFRLQ